MASPILPLAETLPPRDQPPTPAQEHEIATLVERFYDRAREDPALGPIFNARVASWDAHLATMRDFWSSVVYRTGRYAGRPLETHNAIDELRPEHFPLWLGLWSDVVDEVIAPDRRLPFKESARRMADSMAPRLAARAADG